MNKNYLIVLITIIIVGVLTVGCASTPGGQNAQPGQPGSGAGANDGVSADAGVGSDSGTNVGDGTDGTAGAGGGAISDVAAAYPGVFDVLDPDYNPGNWNIQVENGVVYCNVNYQSIYRIDPVTGQKSLIVADGIMVSFAVHGDYVYYYKMQQPYLFRVPVSGGNPVTLETGDIDFSLQIVNMGVIKDTLYLNVAVPSAKTDSDTSTSNDSSTAPSAFNNYNLPYNLSCSADIKGDPDALTFKSFSARQMRALPSPNGYYYQWEMTPNYYPSSYTSFDLYISTGNSDERKEIVSGVNSTNYFITDKYIFYIPTSSLLKGPGYGTINRLGLDGSDEKILFEPTTQVNFLTYDDNWVYYLSHDGYETSGKGIDQLYRFNQETGEIQPACELNFQLYGVANGYVYGYDSDTKDMVRRQLPD